MPVETHYFPEYHLLYDRLYGPAIVEEIGKRQAEHVRFLEQSEIPIHIVADLRFLEGKRPTLSQMQGVMKPMVSPRLLWMVFIVPGNNPIMPFLVSVTAQIVTKGGRIKMVHSIEEAFEFLKQRDSTFRYDRLPEELAIKQAVRR